VICVGELLIAIPSTGSPPTSAEISEPGSRAASACASATSRTRRQADAPPASA
jgi:hypothetical protein